MSHWTGAQSRLNRDLRNRFGSHDYAREELRAEIGQVMVCAELGIADGDFTNNAAYVASWLEKLRSDRKEIFRAAADAQRIADYLLAFHPDYATSQAGPPESMPSADDGDAADYAGTDAGRGVTSPFRSTHSAGVRLDRLRAAEPARLPSTRGDHHADRYQRLHPQPVRQHRFVGLDPSRPADWRRTRARPMRRMQTMIDEDGDTAPSAPAPAARGSNFHLAGDRALARGWPARARDNIAAISLSKVLEQSGRAPTPDEQAQLLRFIGFGASELAQNCFRRPGEDEFRPELAGDRRGARSRRHAGGIRRAATRHAVCPLHAGDDHPWTLASRRTAGLYRGPRAGTRHGHRPVLRPAA